MAHTSSIPAECSLITHGSLSILIKNAYQPQLLKLGVLNPRQLLKRSLDAEHRRFSGRGFLGSLALEEDPGTRVVVKQCLRGGLIRHLSSDIFCGGNRAFDEMRTTCAIVASGIKTAEIIAAVKETLFGPFYRSYLISLELPGCIDLISCFDELKGRTSEQRFRAKAGIFEAVAHAFTAMHRCGIYHRDLHLKNVLLREGRAHNAHEVFIIDFDRAIVKATLRPGEKLNNLMRFNRSIEKYRLVSGTVTRGDQMKLCRAYLAENSDTARMLPRALRRYRMMIKLRRLKWGFRARTARKGAGF